MPFPAKTTEREILEAAIEMVTHQGWEALSMRTLAKQLGVQASSLYHHFHDRSALEAALGRRAAQELFERMSAVRGLRALAKVYVSFARDQPALYQLVCSRPGVEAPELKEIWNRLLKEIGALTGNMDDTGAAVALWSLLHGYATLEAAGKFGSSGDHGALEVGLAALTAGFRSKRNIL